MRKISVLILIVVLFLLGCGGGGGSSTSSSISTTDDGLYPIDPTLNFYTLATSSTATGAQKAAVKYITKNYLEVDDYAIAAAMLEELDFIDLNFWGVYDFNVFNGLSNLKHIIFTGYIKSDFIGSEITNSLNLSRLSHLENLNNLSFTSCDSDVLKNLSTLKNIDTVSFHFDSDYKKIDFLKNCTNIKNLTLDMNYLENVSISSVSTLSSLEEFSLDNGVDQNLSSLSELSSLKSINLYDSIVKDFNFLSNLSNLETFVYTRAYFVAGGLDELPTLTSLKTLSIKLSLFYEEELNISSLKRFSSLTELNLNGCKISAINWADQIPTSLNKLDLSNNKISSVSGIDVLVNLTELNLTFNSLTEVGDISKLKNLEILNLSVNSIANVDALANMPNLKILNIDSTITNLDAFIGTGITINGVKY